MPIEVYEHDGLVEFVGHGDVSVDEIVSTSVEHHMRAPKKLALWNFLEARVSSFRAENFQTVAVKGAELGRLRGGGAKNAIVVSNPDERLLLQAYTGMAGALSPVAHEIFVGRDEAVAWLKGSNGDNSAGEDITKPSSGRRLARDSVRSVHIERGKE